MKVQVNAVLDRLNEKKMLRLFEKLNIGSIKAVYAEVPYQHQETIVMAANLKRVQKYDEALSLYLHVINDFGQLTTETGRMMAKTLCSMNEYLAAFSLLLYCANAKWKDFVEVPKTLYSTNSPLVEMLEQPLPTASAADFYLLIDCVKYATNGDLKPLYERTKAVSGQPNYKNEKSDDEIIQQAKNIAKQLRNAL